MKKKQPSRRCSECTLPFDPDPRIGGRQVTCGAPECQRARHAARCQAWHAANGDSTSMHYTDVVVPFRARQPDYQRRWRLSVRLREIREKMRDAGGGLVDQLRRLSDRVGALSSSKAQTGVLASDVLAAVSTALRGAISALEQLDASTTMLSSMTE